MKKKMGGKKHPFQNEGGEEKVNSVANPSSRMMMFNLPRNHYTTEQLLIC